jgi:hypothetical protein
MEKFMSEIRDYALAVGVSPSTVVQKAGVGGGLTWAKWEMGGSCSMRTADKIRAYIADNPAPQSDEAA